MFNIIFCWSDKNIYLSISRLKFYVSYNILLKDFFGSRQIPQNKNFTVLNVPFSRDYLLFWKLIFDQLFYHSTYNFLFLTLSTYINYISIQLYYSSQYPCFWFIPKLLYIWKCISKPFTHKRKIDEITGGGAEYCMLITPICTLYFSAVP